MITEFDQQIAAVEEQIADAIASGKDIKNLVALAGNLQAQKRGTEILAARQAEDAKETARAAFLVDYRARCLAYMGQEAEDAALGQRINELHERLTALGTLQSELRYEMVHKNGQIMSLYQVGKEIGFTFSELTAIRQALSSETA